MAYENTNVVRRDNKLIIKNVSALGDAGVIEVYSDDEITKVAEITATGVGDFLILKINGTTVTATAAELNKLAGSGAKVASGTQQAVITDPTGGSTVDAEARTAINALIDALQAFGIVASV